MSKANAKRTDEPAQDTPAQQASAASTDTGAAAVVSAPAPSAAADPHRHAGHGGLYTRKGGVTALSQRTQQPTEKAAQ